MGGDVPAYRWDVRLSCRGFAPQQLAEKALRIAAEPMIGRRHPEHDADERDGEQYRDYGRDIDTAIDIGATFTPLQHAAQSAWKPTPTPIGCGANRIARARLVRT